MLDIYWKWFPWLLNGNLRRLWAYLSVKMRLTILKSSKWRSGKVSCDWMIQLMRTEVGQTEHITHDALVNSAYKISERGRTQTAKIRRGEKLCSNTSLLAYSLAIVPVIYTYNGRATGSKRCSTASGAKIRASSCRRGSKCCPSWRSSSGSSRPIWPGVVGLNGD